MNEGSRILELGAGTGAFWLENKDRIPKGVHVMITDFSEGMLASTKHALGAMGENWNYHVVNAEDIPFDDGAFDMVIANHMLYHVKDKTRAFTEIFRVLKPGGRLYAATNGNAHMKESDELAGSCGMQAPSAMSHSSFTLQNGKAQLETFFPSVTLKTFEDGLKVTNTDAFMAYIKSFAEAIPPEILQCIENKVKEIIARDGFFSITKESGLFIAERIS
jgi:ubiquinone/menaquinone biosynthesis C-methylase UbiE